MREFSVVEHQYSSTMNNQPQNGSRGLIVEPVAAAVPASRLSQLWPSVECYQVSNTCSDIIFNDISMPFKVLFHHMQEITILRSRVLELWKVWTLPWFDIKQGKGQFNCFWDSSFANRSWNMHISVAGFNSDTARDTAGLFYVCSTVTALYCPPDFLWIFYYECIG